jgi:hypothetical protein
MITLYGLASGFVIVWAAYRFYVRGCSHDHRTIPMNHRQYCLDCGAKRFHNWNVIGDWKYPQERVK